MNEEELVRELGELRSQIWLADHSPEMEAKKSRVKEILTILEKDYGYIPSQPRKNYRKAKVVNR